MFGQQQKPSTGLFGGTGQTTGSAQPSGFQFGATNPSAASSGGFNFGAATQAAGSAGAGLSASTVGLSSGFGTSATPSKPVGAFSFTAPVTSATANPSAGFSLGATAAAAPLGFSNVAQSSPFGQASSQPKPTLGGGTSQSGLNFGTTATSQPGLTLGGGISQPKPTLGGGMGQSGFAFGGGTSQTGLTLGGAAGQAKPTLGTGASQPGQTSGFPLGGATGQTGLTLGGAAGQAKPTLGGAASQPGLSSTAKTGPSTAAGGLNLGSSSTGFALKLGGATGSAASTGFSLGGTPALSSGGLALAPSTATTPATSTLGGLGAGTTGGLKLGGGLASTTTSAALPSLGGLGKTGIAATSGTAAQLGGLAASTAGVATALSGAKPLPAFGTSTTTSVGISAPSTAAGVSTLTSTASSVPKLTYKQLEEQINKWANELEDYEGNFLDQASQVNTWDRMLMDNGEKITELNDCVETVKAEQKRLDQELDFITAQQHELEDMLVTLETDLKTTSLGSAPIQHADQERENTYKLAKDIDGQLKQMVQDLKAIIDHLNSANSQQASAEDPVVQIAKILNAHMNSLQWIDQNSGLLQRKVDEVARLSEHRRKEQERNLRLHQNFPIAESLRGKSGRAPVFRGGPLSECGHGIEADKWRHEFSSG